MRVLPELDVAPRILVVDDVVTSGATLFASVQLVQDSYPNASVQAFALVRRVDEIRDTGQQCLAPVCGNTTLRQDGRTIREP